MHTTLNATPERLSPVKSHERITQIDALRGFALAGVLFANLASFSGYVILDSEARSELPTAGADQLIEMMTRVLVDDKFITLFSLLFGLGFAIQLGRAQARGRPIAPTYVKRLVVLLILGLAHRFLLWGGDILSTYAVLGFGLLLARGWSNRALIGVGLLLAICMGPAVVLFKVLWGTMGPAPPELREALSSAWENGSYLETMRVQAEYEWWSFTDHGLDDLTYLGLFLVGLWAGRVRLLHNPEQHARLIRRLRTWGGVVGVICTVGVVALMTVFAPTRGGSPGEAPLFVPLILLCVRIGTLALAGFYAAGFMLLYQRSGWRKRMNVFAPIGRTALTNYLLQSVIGVWLFYGFMPGPDLSGDVGLLLCLPIFLVIYTAQIVFSRWWLQHYQFGPMEWLWRSLTYGRFQPMRIERTTPQPVA